MNTNDLTQNLTFHSDAGHGWLAVPEKIIKWIGYRPTSFSYYDHKNKVVFLEEDCDATKFLKLAESKRMTINIVDKYDGDVSPIRRLSRC